MKHLAVFLSCILGLIAYGWLTIAVLGYFPQGNEEELINALVGSVLFAASLPLWLPLPPKARQDRQ